MPVSVNLPGPWSHLYVSSGGSRFHAAVCGPEPAGQDSGPLVVLLHGFPECWWTWREVLPALGQAGYRVAALDLRGFGGSDRPPAGYDLAQLAQDVHGCVRALGHEEAVVIGHGLGGQVAWVMAGACGEMVRAIVPIGAPHPLALRSLRGRRFSGAALQYATLKLPFFPERTLMTRSGMEGLLRSWAAPATRDVLGSGAGYYASLLSRPGAAKSALESLRRIHLGRETLAALSKPVTVPMLAIQGELDPVQPAQAYARDTHYVSGRLQQVTMRGLGHFPQEERPSKLVEVLIPFLFEVLGPGRIVDSTQQPE